MSGVLDKYRPASERSAPDIQTVEGQPYKAFEISPTPLHRININPARDASRLMSYGQIIDILHVADIITFLFHHCKVEIEGRNLSELIAMLQEDRIKSIEEFVPEYHQAQPEDAPIILKLIVTDSLTKNPEPKIDARH